MTDYRLDGKTLRTTERKRKSETTFFKFKAINGFPQLQQRFFFLFFRANKFLAIKGTGISLQLINVILYAIVTHAILCLWRRFSAPLYI